MGHGGKRTGAGRKKGFSAIESEKAREYITQRVVESLVPIVDVLIERAKQGDLKCTRELFDRAWGRPPQSIQSTMDAVRSVQFSIPAEIAVKHGVVLSEQPHLIK